MSFTENYPDIFFYDEASERLGLPKGYEVDEAIRLGLNLSDARLLQGATRYMLDPSTPQGLALQTSGVRALHEVAQNPTTIPEKASFARALIDATEAVTVPITTVSTL